MRLRIFAAAIVGASAIPTVAWAADAPNFGKSGQLAVSWDQALVTGGAAGGIGGTPPSAWSMLDLEYSTANNNGGSVTGFGLAPAADFFVIDNLSVGAQVLFGLVSTSPPSPQQGTTTTYWGIAPQVGYNIGLTDSISFWPKIYFSYASFSQNNNGPTSNYGAIGLFAPILYHPARHFFLGLGPNVSTQVINSQSESAAGATVTTYPDKVTTLGLMATFGGYFLGD